MLKHPHQTNNVDKGYLMKSCIRFTLIVKAAFEIEDHKNHVSRNTVGSDHKKKFRPKKSV
jgi:hypothetical protein